jgi:hypothetical protein
VREVVEAEQLNEKPRYPVAVQQPEVTAGETVERNRSVKLT